MYYLITYSPLQHVCFVSGVPQADYWRMKRGEIVIPFVCIPCREIPVEVQCFLFLLLFNILHVHSICLRKYEMVQLLTGTLLINIRLSFIIKIFVTHIIHSNPINNACLTSRQSVVSCNLYNFSKIQHIYNVINK